MELIDRVIQDLEDGLKRRREEFNDGSLISDRIEIEVLGQMSLLMNKDVSSKINLAATADVDAKLKGRWGEAQVFREVLKAHGLKYDELSTEVWIPKDAKFIEYYNSPYVKVSYLDPVSALTSKAVKAKEKNRLLVSNALKIFGETLASQIISHGGDLAYFKISKGLKL